MAQAAHGSAPDIAGRNISNPVGMLLSGVMLLDWMADRHGDESLEKMARYAENAILETLSDGICTKDLGGSASTTDFTQAIVDKIKKCN